MNLEQARKKAKRLLGKYGQALHWAGRCEVGVYRPVHMANWMSFHMITSAKTFEEAFTELEELDAKARP